MSVSPEQYRASLSQKAYYLMPMVELQLDPSPEAAAEIQRRGAQATIPTGIVFREPREKGLW